MCNILNNYYLLEISVVKSFSSVFAVLGIGLLLGLTSEAQAEKIVYKGDTAPNSNPNIYIMNEDGSDKKLVIDYSQIDWYPALSYDNTKVAFIGYKWQVGQQLFTVNVDGTNLTQITPDGGGFLAPSWSPDGKQIVCMGRDKTSSTDDDIYIMNSDGTNLRVLANVAEDFLPSWSPDGKKIIFNSSASTSALSSNVVYSISPDGTNLQAITPPGNYGQLSWSPDSKKILYAYANYSEQTHELLDSGLGIMNADGSNPIVLKHGTDVVGFPRFLENGRIAFTMSATGEPTQIYSMKADGTDIQPLTNGSLGNSQPSTAFNVAPFAPEQTVTTNEDTTVDFVLAAVDSNGDTLEYSIVSKPSQGTLSGPAPKLSYTPNPNFNGNDSFTYRVSDGKLSTNVVVQLKVNPVNDTPVAAPQTLETQEDTALNITLAGTDIDSTVNKFLINQHPSYGRLSGEYTAQGQKNLVYTPFGNFNGEDSFTFYVGDGMTYSTPATVRINVIPLNDAPIATPGYQLTLENTPANLQLQATDDDGDALAYSIVSQPLNGTLSGAGSQRVYTPKADFVGNDSFTFQASDGAAKSGIVIFNISVDARVPIAANDSYTLDMRPKKAPAKLSVTKPGLLANDSDDDALSALVSTKPTKGTLKLNRDGSFTFTPPNNRTATYTFAYVASDGKYYSSPATVTISVLGR
jgi:Tol biopolymer transport system component